MHLCDIPLTSEGAFYKTVVPMMNEVVNDLLDHFIMEIRKKLKHNKSVGIIVDGGWSHPGWWAREHTVVALDDVSGLPIGFYHVIKGTNYQGSSRGMEGFGVQKIMEDLKRCGIVVTRLTHDRDASTFKNVLEVFEDVAESFCTSKSSSE